MSAVFAERRRIRSLLAHWASITPDWWPGIPRTHTALLAHLSAVLDVPAEPCPDGCCWRDCDADTTVCLVCGHTRTVSSS